MSVPQYFYTKLYKQQFHKQTSLFKNTFHKKTTLRLKCSSSILKNTLKSMFFLDIFKPINFRVFKSKFM